MKIPSIKELEKYYDPAVFYNALVLKKIDLRMAKIFIKSGITPNQITILSQIVGIIGAILFAYSNPIYWILGWFVINFYMILDGSDGIVARYTKTTSKFGAFLDEFTHPIINTLIFVPMSFGLYRIFGDPLVFLLGFSSVFSMLLVRTFNLSVKVKRKKVLYDTSAEDFISLKNIAKIPIELGGMFHIILLCSLIDLILSLSFTGFGETLSFRLLFLVLSGCFLPMILLRKVFKFYQKSFSRNPKKAS